MSLLIGNKKQPDPADADAEAEADADAEAALAPAPAPAPHAPPSSQRGELTEIMVGLQPRIAYVHPGLTPLMARELNLTEVTTALADAGIEHFVVRGIDNQRPVVGVTAEARPRVLDALARLCATRPGYLCQVVPAPTTRVVEPTDDPSIWRQLATATVIRLIWFRTEPTRSLVLDDEWGCEVEFWTRDRHRDRLYAPRPSHIMTVAPAAATPVPVPADRFTQLTTAHRGPQPALRSRIEFTHRLYDDIEFPIDAVYTWVDGADPAWRARHDAAAGQGYHEEAASPARYLNRDELRYSLRSLHAHAPWIRDIYLVTDDQVPAWLDTTHPRLRVVSHREIFSDPGVLPVFNSAAIESQLHHIDGLSEHFLYFNDDMFLGRSLPPQRFFQANGLVKFFASRTRIPLGPVEEHDTPVQAMVKNNRALLEKRFGRTITQGTQHAPYPLRRSLLYEIEQCWPDEHRTTMSSRFRGTDNLTITYSLHHYYAYLSGRAVPGSIRYGYIQLAVPDLADRLARLLARRDQDTFCLNDAYSTEEELQAQHLVLAPFLKAYFPVPSPYEKR